MRIRDSLPCHKIRHCFSVKIDLFCQTESNPMAEINIRNKKAWHEYEFLEHFTAGMQLTGTEIKSIRAGKASLVDAYCFFSDNELWVKGMHISEYDFGNLNNHD